MLLYMNRTELDSVFFQSISYHCFQQDAVYRFDPAEVVSVDYDTDGHTFISEWLLSTISEPSIETLMEYTLESVNDYWNYSYDVPKKIEDTCNWVKLTSSEVSKIPSQFIPAGALIVQNGYLMVWKNESWVEI